MARYETEFVGIPGRFTRPEGLDPNYRDGYCGMRMGAEGGQAPYGAHRLHRRHDLETAGGFPGIHSEIIGRSRYDAPLRGYRSTGGVRDPRERELLRDFDSRSGSHVPVRPSRYDGETTYRRTSEPAWMPSRTYRPGYTNRGVPPAGFGEGWARGPMRGSR